MLAGSVFVLLMAGQELFDMRDRRATGFGQKGEPGTTRRVYRKTRSSERDLVVAVDQLGFSFSADLGTVEEVDLLGDDLTAVAVDTCRIGPLRVVDAALDHHPFMPFAMPEDRPACGPLKQVMRCHSVSTTRKPCSSCDRAAFPRDAGARWPA